jgi:hypothetical protein
MLLSDLPSRTSSFGAIIGRRSVRLAEAWPRRFCITKLVTVIRLTGCLRRGLAGGWGLSVLKDRGKAVAEMAIHTLRG